MFKDKIEATKNQLLDKVEESEDMAMSDLENEEDTFAKLLPGDRNERDKALFDMIIDKFSKNLIELRERNER